MRVTSYLIRKVLELAMDVGILAPLMLTIHNFQN